MGLGNDDLKNRYWPAINDLATAKKVAKQGVWAAAFVAVVTAVFAILALLGKPLAGVEGTALVEAAIFAAIAFGIWKMSRVAATAGLVLFVVEKILALQDRQRPVGVFLAIAITFAFANAVRATFRYHKLLTAGSGGFGVDPINPA